MFLAIEEMRQGLRDERWCPHSSSIKSGIIERAKALFKFIGENNEINPTRSRSGLGRKK